MMPVRADVGEQLLQEKKDSQPGPPSPQPLAGQSRGHSDSWACAAATLQSPPPGPPGFGLPSPGNRRSSLWDGSNK